MPRTSLVSQELEGYRSELGAFCYRMLGLPFEVLEISGDRIAGSVDPGGLTER